MSTDTENETTENADAHSSPHLRRSKRNSLNGCPRLEYDQHYHPLDEVSRPANARKRRRAHMLSSPNGMLLLRNSPSRHNNVRNNGSSKRVRRSKRLSTSCTKPLYDKKKHPQDEEIEFEPSTSDEDSSSETEDCYVARSARSALRKNHNSSLRSSSAPARADSPHVEETHVSTASVETPREDIDILIPHYINASESLAFGNAENTSVEEETLRSTQDFSQQANDPCTLASDVSENETGQNDGEVSDATANTLDHEDERDFSHDGTFFAHEEVEEDDDDDHQSPVSPSATGLENPERASSIAGTPRSSQYDNAASTTPSSDEENPARFLMGSQIPLNGRWQAIRRPSSGMASPSPELAGLSSTMDRSMVSSL